MSTRKVEIAGIGSSPDGWRMNQIGATSPMRWTALLNGKRYLMHDGDPLFTARVPEPAERNGRCLGEVSPAQSQLYCPECGQISVAWLLFDSGFAGKTQHENLAES